MVGAGMTPFAEHFALGIKDLIPMAYSDCVSHVDKGIDKSEIEAAWFGELSTTDGSSVRDSGGHPRPHRHPGDPRVENCLRNR